MISIVVCSQNDILFQNLVNNIRNTIGIPFEVIQTHADKGYGICYAYNNGAARSNFDILLFIHEDIYFHSQNWGLNLITHFKKLNNVGLIGLAGSKIKTRMLSSWWQPVLKKNNFNRYKYIQSYKFQKSAATTQISNPNNSLASHVVTLDGFFLATTKNIWHENRFADNVLKGFHAYDLEYSLRIAQQFNNYVIYDVNVEHYSEGKMNLSWFVENLLVHKKYNSVLPSVFDKNLVKSKIKFIDQWNFYRSIELLNSLNISFITRLSLIFQIICLDITVIFNFNIFRKTRKILYHTYD